VSQSYEQPTVVDHGSLADLTQQTGKSLGGNDGFVLVPSGITLGNVS